MNTFTEREKAFEAKFAQDSEVQFRVYVRRNKILGLWAAELLGKDGDEADYWGPNWDADPDADGLVNLLDPDSDNDGLNDGVEVILFGTNPSLADTDGNGFTDAEEIQCDSDPLDPNSRCNRLLPWLMLLLE